jgi:hypothetical protein
MLNATVKATRLSKMTPAHQTLNTALRATGQTLATLASAVGISQDLCEKQLSALIDEGLCTRTHGSRVTALYASA